MNNDKNSAEPAVAGQQVKSAVKTVPHNEWPVWANYLVSILNTLVLIGSVLIIVGLSIEVFNDSDKLYYTLYMRLQLWVCIVFLVDFFVRFFLSHRKWRFLAKNIIFFLVAIPYFEILDALQLQLSAEVSYLLRLMPLIRGGYGLAIMVGWITRNRTTSLMVSYLLMLLALIYFASLVFYSLEHSLNPMVTSFGASLSWAFMNVTTVGSNIYAQTATGKVLAVVLAASGMMMFPIFTVYITSRFQSLWRGKGGDKKDRSDITGD